MLISQLAQKCFSIFAFAVVCFFVCHPVRDLLLLLPLSVPPSPVPAVASSPLSVPAVILTLSVVERGRIPKNSTSQNHHYFSTHNLLRLCRCLFFFFFQNSKPLSS